MMRRWLLAVAIAVLIAGSVMFAQEQGLVQKWVVPPTNYGVAPMTTCFAGTADQFDILNDVTVGYNVTSRYDRSGTLVEETWHATNSLDVYFNSTDPTKRAEAPPGAHQIAHFDYKTGLMNSTAMYTFLTVPGHGRILAQVGLFVYDFVNHQVLYSRGPNDVFSGTYDWTPLCEALK
ncbi:MAG: hypothetical protein ACM3NQ_21535 [Bacteroidales bacterium]